jgi:16S rRNA (adenine1518-N6/adenine1519-N6)-dimethyltransferase
MMQYRCSVELLFIVPPAAFTPAPKVDSAFVRLIPHRQPPVNVYDEDVFKQVITQAFAQRRKTLRNTLKGTLSIEEIEAAGIDTGLRAETLTLEQFACLSNIVSTRNEQH